MHRSRNRQRNKESGVTMLLVVLGMFTILSMAALAIDLAALYAARTDAQRAADAAALAGARMFVLSGFTSGQLGSPSSTTTQDQVCKSSAGSAGTGLANQQADGVTAQNQLAGQTAAITGITCDFSNTENPRITVTTGRADVATFFAKIFGRRTVGISAAATAEAFNASGSAVPVSVGSVKPWLIPNCDPGAAPCAGGSYFVDSTNNYILKTPSNYIGQVYTFTQRIQGNPPQASEYYAIDLPQATVCPSSGAIGCSSVGLGLGTAGYLDNIACANTNRLSCGASITFDNKNGLPPTISDTISGTQCLIHTGTTGTGGTDQDSFSTGTAPIIITGGLSNPNPALHGITNISRSDSVVTVPVFDWTVDPCTGPGGKCGGTANVVGFLQLGINYVSNVAGTSGDIRATVLNAVGCNPGNTGTPISGGGVSAIPVRLVN